MMFLERMYQKYIQYIFTFMDLDIERPSILTEKFRYLECGHVHSPLVSSNLHQ